MVEIAGRHRVRVPQILRVAAQQLDILMLNAGTQTTKGVDLSHTHLCGRPQLQFRNTPLAAGRVAEPPAVDFARRHSSLATELQAAASASSARRSTRRKNSGKSRGTLKQERSQSVLDRLLADEPGSLAEPDSLGAATSKQQAQYSSQDTGQRTGNGAAYPWRAAEGRQAVAQQLQPARQPIVFVQPQPASAPMQPGASPHQARPSPAQGQHQPASPTPPILQLNQGRNYLSPSQHVLEDDAHPLRPSAIPLFTRRAFSRLRAEGALAGPEVKQTLLVCNACLELLLCRHRDHRAAAFPVG